MVQAALGGEFTVPTVDGGQAKVKIPEGTQSGKQFRIKGKGMPILRSRDVGDLYIQAMVETPQNLTSGSANCWPNSKPISSKTTQPEVAGFFDKIKDFFDQLSG